MSAGTRRRVGEPSSPRLLVVEDEPDIRELLSATLRLAGFQVTEASDGLQALAYARRERPDLVLLDVTLPGSGRDAKAGGGVSGRDAKAGGGVSGRVAKAGGGVSGRDAKAGGGVMDGFAVVRRLRAEGVRVPVLFLSGRDATEDKVTGLRLGGGDYVTKPFSLQEVVARVEALLRRAGGPRPGGPAGRLCFADIELDEQSHDVYKAGVAVTLSATEFKLLRYFLTNPARVLSKRQILNHVWEYGLGPGTNAVESYVSYLRKKVDTSVPRLIHTVRGVGYVLRLPPA